MAGQLYTENVEISHGPKWKSGTRISLITNVPKLFRERLSHRAKLLPNTKQSTLVSV